MTREEFNNIIDFAIEREKEAVIFYHNLQQNTSFKANKELFRDFEDMEKGHIRILDGIKKDIFEKGDVQIPKVENLKISDYLVETKPEADMKYQDILITAMKREEKAYNLYTRLGNNASDPKIKKLFLHLAAEEAKHKNLFERIYDDEILQEN